MLDSRDSKSHWRRTASLALLVLLIACVVVLAFLSRVVQLNSLIVLGFPVGFYVVAQGLVIGIVFAAFWVTARQERLDRKFGIEDD